MIAVSHPFSKNRISCNIQIKKEIGEMQDFWQNYTKKVRFPNVIFKSVKIMRFQFSTFDTPTLKK